MMEAIEAPPQHLKFFLVNLTMKEFEYVGDYIDGIFYEDGDLSFPTDPVTVLLAIFSEGVWNNTEDIRFYNNHQITEDMVLFASSRDERILGEVLGMELPVEEEEEYVHPPTTFSRYSSPPSSPGVVRRV